MGFFASPSQPNRRCELNSKNLYYVLVIAIMVIPELSFLILKARSVYEYGITIYVTITMIGMVMYYAIIGCQLGKMLKMIEKYEEIIEKRLC